MKRLFPFLPLAALLAWAGCSQDDMGMSGGDGIPVIPVELIGIEAVNVDNAGEFPLSTAGPVSRQAYMIGIRWQADNADPDGEQSITPPIAYDPWNGDGSHLSDPYTKRIYSLDAFNEQNPAGSNISQYFKQATWLPSGVDEGFVLLVTPDPGPHAFRVVYSRYDGTRMECETSTITFF